MRFLHRHCIKVFRPALRCPDRNRWLPAAQPLWVRHLASAGIDALPGVGWCEVRVLFDARSCIKTSLLHLQPYFKAISSSPEWEVSSSRCQRGRRQLPSRFPPRMARQAL